MLLAVIGYRQKGGVSKSRVGEILGLEASSYLDDLLSQGLIDLGTSWIAGFTLGRGFGWVHRKIGLGYRFNSG